MLYQSTRSKIDTYTAHRVLHQDLKREEGQVLPMQIPVIPEDELQNILSMSFADAASCILNIFFPGRITAWDISCALGKMPARVDVISSKFLMGVLWDNRSGSAECLIDEIYNKLCDTASVKPTQWSRIAICISLIFGLLAEMKSDIEQVDFATASCNFETVFAAWYARRMGAPIGTILCVCNENSNCWDLLNRGSINTGIQTIKTALPEMDVQDPVYLESLLYSALGMDAVISYVSAAENGKTYTLDDEQLPILNSGIYACVVGSGRVSDVISSVSKIDGYALDVYAAAVYGGVQDYRAKTGKQNHTLVWVDHKPQ